MHSCQKEDDDRSQDFRAAQKEVAEKIRIKEESLSMLLIQDWYCVYKAKTGIFRKYMDQCCRHATRKMV